MCIKITGNHDFIPNFPFRILHAEWCATGYYFHIQFNGCIKLHTIVSLHKIYSAEGFESFILEKNKSISNGKSYKNLNILFSSSIERYVYAYILIMGPILVSNSRANNGIISNDPLKRVLQYDFLIRLEGSRMSEGNSLIIHTKVFCDQKRRGKVFIRNMSAFIFHQAWFSWSLNLSWNWSWNWIVWCVFFLWKSVFYFLVRFFVLRVAFLSAIASLKY